MSFISFFKQRILSENIFYVPAPAMRLLTTSSDNLGSFFHKTIETTTELFNYYSGRTFTKRYKLLQNFQTLDSLQTTSITQILGKETSNHVLVKTIKQYCDNISSNTDNFYMMITDRGQIFGYYIKELNRTDNFELIFLILKGQNKLICLRTEFPVYLSKEDRLEAELFLTPTDIDQTLSVKDVIRKLAAERAFYPLFLKKLEDDNRPRIYSEILFNSTNMPASLINIIKNYC